jgi:tetratricopeptide (TPR) repeat protein
VQLGSVVLALRVVLAIRRTLTPLFLLLRIVSAGQLLSWKAGHKRNCVAEETADRQKQLEARVPAASGGATPSNATVVSGLPQGRPPSQGAATSQTAAGTTDLRLQMIACMHLGANNYEKGAMTQAIEPFEKAKAIAQELRERSVQMKMCINLGACYFTSKRTKKAAVTYEQARAIAEKIGDREELLKVHVSLGACYGTMQQFDRAIMQYEQAIRIGDEMGELDWKGKAFTGMVKCKLALRSMQIRTSIDNGDSCLSRQQHHEAIGHYAEGRVGAQDLNDQAMQVKACIGLLASYRALQQYDMQLQVCAEYKALAEKLGDSEMQIKACRELGYAYHQLQGYDEAFRHYQISLAIAEQLDDPEERQRVRSNISDEMAQCNRLLRCGKKEEGCPGLLDLSEPGVLDPQQHSMPSSHASHSYAMPSSHVAPFHKKEGTQTAAAAACGTLSAQGEEKKNADYNAYLLLREEEADNKNVNKKRYKNKKRKDKVSGKRGHTVTAAGAVKVDEDKQYKQDDRKQLCGNSLLQVNVPAAGPNQAEAPVLTSPHRSELGNSLQVLLEKYDLENEPLLDSMSIKKLSHLQSLTCDVIKHLTLSPVSKAKLTRMVADVAWVHGPVEGEVFATSSTQPADGDSVEGGECVVCLEMQAQIAVIPCGHVCLCAGCNQHQHFCPICRVPVTGSLRVYFSAWA